MAHNSTPAAETTAPTPSSSAVPWLAGLALVGVTAGLAAFLSHVATAGWPNLLPDYAQWQAHAYTGTGSFLNWVVGDTTEAEFFKSGLGGLGMIGGAAVAHIAWKRRSPWAGFPISYGTGLWPWLFASASMGLLLSDIAWGWTLNTSGVWQPTFVPFVSVPPAVVLVYGGGWTVAVTGAVLGAALTTPIALLVVNFFCTPLALPEVIGNVTGMWAGALIAFFLCRYLPWMPRPLNTMSGDDHDQPPDQDATATAPQGPSWVVRRALADFTEAQFYGNEIAAVGLIGGTMLAYLINPLNPVYGTELLPALLIAQVLTATIGVLVHHRRWAAAGSVPDLRAGRVRRSRGRAHLRPDPTSVIVGAVFGAFAGPPVAAWISARLPHDFHPFIGNVISMAVCTLIAIPLLDQLPGFTAAS